MHAFKSRSTGARRNFSRNGISSLFCIMRKHASQLASDVYFDTFRHSNGVGRIIFDPAMVSALILASSRRKFSSKALGCVDDCVSTREQEVCTLDVPFGGWRLIGS